MIFLKAIRKLRWQSRRSLLSWYLTHHASFYRRSRKSNDVYTHTQKDRTNYDTGPAAMLFRRRNCWYEINEALSSNRILPAMPQTAVFLPLGGTPDGSPGWRGICPGGYLSPQLTHTLGLAWFRLALLRIKLRCSAEDSWPYTPCLYYNTFWLHACVISPLQV